MMEGGQVAARHRARVEAHHRVVLRVRRDEAGGGHLVRHADHGAGIDADLLQIGAVGIEIVRPGGGEDRAGLLEQGERVGDVPGHTAALLLHLLDEEGDAQDMDLVRHDVVPEIAGEVHDEIVGERPRHDDLAGPSHRAAPCHTIVRHATFFLRIVSSQRRRASYMRAGNAKMAAHMSSRTHSSIGEFGGPLIVQRGCAGGIGTILTVRKVAGLRRACPSTARDECPVSLHLLARTIAYVRTKGNTFLEYIGGDLGRALHEREGCRPSMRCFCKLPVSCGRIDTVAGTHHGQH